MNMPRFTADSSLYLLSAYNQASAILSGLKQEEKVVPAIKCESDKGGFYVLFNNVLLFGLIGRISRDMGEINSIRLA